MMKKKRKAIAFALTGLLLAVSFALPEAVMAFRDAAIESAEDSVTIDEVELSLISSLTPVEKLRIAGDTATATIPLDSGVNLSEMTLPDAAAKTGWAFPDSSDPMTFDGAEPRLAVGNDGKSFVLWDVLVSSGDQSACLLLDDETGALLGYTLQGSVYDQEASKAPQKQTAGEVPASEAAAEADSGPLQEFAAEDYMELSRIVLDPVGLQPDAVLYSASGVLVSVEESDLTIRITVTGDGSNIRLNMG